MLRLAPGLHVLRLLVLDSLHGIGQQVHEHADQLRLRPHYQRVLQSEILESDIVLVVEH